MKRAMYLLAIGLFCASSLLFLGQTDNTSVEINKAISSGNTENLAVYFAPEMELNLQNSQNYCSKSQATKVLQEFFRQNKPSDYVSDNNRNYISGVMTTSEGKSYKVNYTLKTVNNQAVITGLYVY
ncbi:MAG: DUF4783 domain-containing protein [Bacteroidales bacterium]|jgi:hypothetical protein|nr:DUF4783 domain-containing protein [Bacteroidales bacterium]